MTEYDKSNRVARTWTARNSLDTTRFADLSYCRSPFTGAACPTTSASTDTGLIQWSVDNLTGIYCRERAEGPAAAAIDRGARSRVGGL